MAKSGGNAELTTLRKYPQRAAAVLTEYREALGKTRGRTVVKDERKNKHVTDLRDETAKRLETLQEEAEDAWRKYSRNTDRALEHPQGDVNQQLLAEMRQQRAWDRVRAELDTAEHPDVLLLNDILPNADYATVAALRAEIGPYFRSKKQEGYLPQLDRAVEAEWRKYWSPEQWSAHLAREKAAKNYQRVQVAASAALDAMRDADNPAILPDWEDGKIITVEAAVPVTESEEEQDLVASDVLPSLSTSY